MRSFGKTSRRVHLRQICAYSAIIVLMTPMQWTVHPARVRPVAAIWAVVAIAVVATLIAQLAGDWFWGAISAVGLFISLTRFFLTTRYRIDAEVAEVIYPLSMSRLRWDEVGCIRWQDRRALVARSISRREQMRGLVFDFTNLSVDTKAQLREFVLAQTSPEVWQ